MNTFNFNLPLFTVDAVGNIVTRSGFSFEPGFEFTPLEEGGFSNTPQIDVRGRLSLRNNRYAAMEVPEALSEVTTAGGLTISFDASSSIAVMLAQIELMRKAIYGMFSDLNVKPALFIRAVVYSTRFDGGHVVLTDFVPLEDLNSADFLMPMQRGISAYDTMRSFAEDGIIAIGGATPLNGMRRENFVAGIHFASWAKSHGKHCVLVNADITDGQNTDGVENSELKEMRELALSIPVGKSALILRHTERVYYCGSSNPGDSFKQYCDESGAEGRFLAPAAIPADMKELFVSGSQILDQPKSGEVSEEEDE
jgi:hypothetical protein